MANGPFSHVDPSYVGDPLAPLRERLHKLELLSTDKEQLSKLRGEIYEHVGRLLADNKTQIMDKVEDKMVNTRGAILSDVDKLGGDLHRAVTDGIKEAFSTFIDKELPRIIEAQIEARDDRRKTERDNAVKRWRSRVLLATAFVGLGLAVWDAVSTRQELREAKEITQQIDRAGRAIQP